MVEKSAAHAQVKNEPQSSGFNGGETQNREVTQAMKKLSNLEALCSRAQQNQEIEDANETTKLSCLGAKYGMRLCTIEQDFHDAYNRAQSQVGEQLLLQRKEVFEDARIRIAKLKTMIKNANTTFFGKSG